MSCRCVCVCVHVPETPCCDNNKRNQGITLSVLVGVSARDLLSSRLLCFFAVCVVCGCSSCVCAISGPPWESEAGPAAAARWYWTGTELGTCLSVYCIALIVLPRPAPAACGTAAVPVCRLRPTSRSTWLSLEMKVHRSLPLRSHSRKAAAPCACPALAVTSSHPGVVTYLDPSPTR